jgi:hypothetical protein
MTVLHLKLPKERIHTCSEFDGHGQMSPWSVETASVSKSNFSRIPNPDGTRVDRDTSMRPKVRSPSPAGQQPSPRVRDENGRKRYLFGNQFFL